MTPEERALVSVVRYLENFESNCLPLWVDQGDGGVVGSTKD